MTRTLRTALVLAGITAASWAAAAPDRGPPRDHAAPPIARIVMGNLMAEQLAARTGRPVDDVRTLITDLRPRALAEELGLDRDDMRALMHSARAELLIRLQAANLITSDQALRLKERASRKHNAQRQAPGAP